MRNSISGIPTRRKPRLLVVEDDPDLRVLVQFAAKRSEAFSTVCTAEDGEAALALIRSGFAGGRQGLPPDLVFTDYHMPKLNGLELARQLRGSELTRSIPVALFTAEVFDPSPATAEAAGCQAVYRKPANFRELLRIMKSLPKLCGGHDGDAVEKVAPFAGAAPLRINGRPEEAQRGAA